AAEPRHQDTRGQCRGRARRAHRSAHAGRSPSAPGRVLAGRGPVPGPGRNGLVRPFGRGRIRRLHLLRRQL
ncbi:MAG: hypothetical protein AVDCRST_MAG10-158, partial [uncultured Acidimicrobiales bacterium]